ncbi:unnamed protein product, partial [marine sediment metagenome]
MLRAMGLEGPFPYPAQVKEELINCLESSSKLFPEIENYSEFMEPLMPGPEYQKLVEQAYDDFYRSFTLQLLEQLDPIHVVNFTYFLTDGDGDECFTYNPVLNKD